MLLYRSIDVWKKVDDSTAVRYRCFECLQSGHYSVQSTDIYRLPLDERRAAYLDSQFLELFIQQEPAGRAGEYSTLRQAIAAHDEDFS